MGGFESAAHRCVCMRRHVATWQAVALAGLRRTTSAAMSHRPPVLVLLSFCTRAVACPTVAHTPGPWTVAPHGSRSCLAGPREAPTMGTCLHDAWLKTALAAFCSSCSPPLHPLPCRLPLFSTHATAILQAPGWQKLDCATPRSLRTAPSVQSGPPCQSPCRRQGFRTAPKPAQEPFFLPQLQLSRPNSLGALAVRLSFQHCFFSSSPLPILLASSWTLLVLSSPSLFAEFLHIRTRHDKG